MKKTTLFLDEKIYKAVKQLAVEKDTTIQRLINEALQQILYKREGEKKIMEEKAYNAYWDRVMKAVDALSKMNHFHNFNWEEWEKEYERDKGTCRW